MKAASLTPPLLEFTEDKRTLSKFAPTSFCGSGTDNLNISASFELCLCVCFFSQSLFKGKNC